MVPVSDIWKFNMRKKKSRLKIFSALEVADLCGVVNQTAINWIKSGYLKAFITPGGQYRIYTEDLLEFLESRGMKIPDVLHSLCKESNKKCVLIYLEDSFFLRLLHEKIESGCPNYQIILPLSPFEAGVLATREKPDFIILSSNMDGISDENLEALFPYSRKGEGDSKQKLIVVKDKGSSSPLSFVADFTVDCSLEAELPASQRIVSFIIASNS